MKQSVRKYSLALSLLTTFFVITGCSMQAVPPSIPDASSIKIMEEDLLACAKIVPKSNFAPNAYSLKIKEGPYIYYAVFNKKKLTVRKRDLSIIGARNFGPNPPREREYPSIVFVNDNLDGVFNERKIVRGFVSEKAANDLLGEETFPEILQKFLDVCSHYPQTTN